MRYQRYIRGDVTDGQMDGQTDQPTDGQTDGRTDPIVEMR